MIGEDELALRSAAELATVAHHVHLVGLTQEALKSPLGRKLNMAGNVTVLAEYQVARVEGNGYCDTVVARSPDGHEVNLKADGTFVEKGLVPNANMVANLVDLDSRGSIKVDAYSRTSTPGVFAAGDVTNIYAEQVLVAVGEGAKAALSAYDYLLQVR